MITSDKLNFIVSYRHSALKLYIVQAVSRKGTEDLERFLVPGEIYDDYYLWAFTRDRVFISDVILRNL